MACATIPTVAVELRTYSTVTRKYWIPVGGYHVAAALASILWLLRSLYGVGTTLIPLLVTGWQSGDCEHVSIISGGGMEWKNYWLRSQRIWRSWNQLKSFRGTPLVTISLPNSQSILLSFTFVTVPSTALKSHSKHLPSSLPREMVLERNHRS